MNLTDGEKLILLMMSELYEKLGIEGEVEYIGVFDIRNAEPESYMEDRCQDGLSCSECPHFTACYQNLTEN